MAMKKHASIKDPFWALVGLTYDKFLPSYLADEDSRAIDRLNKKRNALRYFMGYRLDTFRGMDYEET